MSPLRAARCPLSITALAVGYAVFAAYGALAQPVAQFKRPPEGAVISDQIYIEVAFDSKSTEPVTRIVLYVDNQAAFDYALKTPQGYGRQVFKWNTKQLASGAHVLMAKVYDAQGRVCESPPQVRVFVDNGAGGPGPDVPTPAEPDEIPPTVRISSPANGATVHGKIEIGVEATDKHGVKFVFVYIDDQFKSLTNRPPYRFMQDTTKLENGLHVITAAAVDPTDNRGESAKVYVKVDNPRYATEATSAPPSGRVLMGPRPPTTPTIGSSEGWASPPATEATGARVTGSPDREPLPRPSLVRMAMLPGVRESATPSVRADRPTKQVKMGPPVASVARLDLPPMPTAARAPAWTPERTVGGTMRATPPSAITPHAAALAAMQSKSEPSRRPMQTAALTKLVAWPELAPARATRPTAAPRTGVRAPLTTPSEMRQYTLPSFDAVLARLPTVVTSHGPRATAPLGAPQAAQRTGKPPATAAVATDKAVAYAALPRPSAAGAPLRDALPPSQPRSSRPGLKPVEHIVHLGGKQFKVVFDDTQLELRSSPVAKQGVPMGPIREIFEHTGGQVHWYPVEKRVRAANDRAEVELKIGDQNAKLNEERVVLKLAPYIKEGRTMVPFSFLERALNVTVMYEPDTDRILITSNEL